MFCVAGHIHPYEIDAGYPPSEWRGIMSTAEEHPYQDLSSRWRRFAGAWPLYIVILGTVLSLGWTVMLVWVVLDLVG